MNTNHGQGRLIEVDSLRGLAAMAVVLFHYTTRFGEMFKPDLSPAVFVPYGYYGVNLFFIISGFVIFMTLDKTKKPMDFVVSRFSRLFPAYWVAIFLTYSITHVLGLPGLEVSLRTAIANMVMLHGLFRVANVDGVYWTLEVELLFYCGMFLLYRVRRLHWVHWALLTLLALRLIYALTAKLWGIDLPWIVSHLLILQHIAWFALGISIYSLINPSGAGGRYSPLVTIAVSVCTLSIADSIVNGLLAVVFTAFVFLAASGKTLFLRYHLFVWLGAISYPLYLLHENIGWSVQLRLHALGWSANAAVLAALALSLALAHWLSVWVERPAMRWIRGKYSSIKASAP